MKKHTDMIIKTANEKRVMMMANHSATKKSKQYIYTEADLGEGLLDEGVNSEYLSFKKKNSGKKSNLDIYSTDALYNENNTAKVFNIDEDLSYAYYF